MQAELFVLTVDTATSMSAGLYNVTTPNRLQIMKCSTVHDQSLVVIKVLTVSSTQPASSSIAVSSTIPVMRLLSWPNFHVSDLRICA
jgi:hypothetical protein